MQPLGWEVVRSGSWAGVTKMFCSRVVVSHLWLESGL